MHTRGAIVLRNTKRRQEWQEAISQVAVPPGGGTHPSYTPGGTQDTPPRVPAAAAAHPRVRVYVCVWYRLSRSRFLQDVRGVDDRDDCVFLWKEKEAVLSSLWGLMVSDILIPLNVNVEAQYSLAKFLTNATGENRLSLFIQSLVPPSTASLLSWSYKWVCTLRGAQI